MVMDADAVPARDSIAAAVITGVIVLIRYLSSAETCLTTYRESLVLFVSLECQSDRGSDRGVGGFSEGRRPYMPHERYHLQSENQGYNIVHAFWISEQRASGARGQNRAVQRHTAITRDDEDAERGPRDR